MQIAIISDMHDSLEKLRFVLKEIENLGIKQIICCGDICAPFMAKEMGKFPGEVHCVFGNVEDRINTPKVCEEYSNLHHYGDKASIEIDNKRIGIIHYPEEAEEMAKSGNYDFVFHGHTHEKRAINFGDCLLLNPGEILGIKGSPSYAVVDLNTAKYSHIIF